MRIPNPLTPELQQRTNGIGRILALVGGAIMIARALPALGVRSRKRSTT